MNGHYMKIFAILSADAFANSNQSFSIFSSFLSAVIQLQARD